ncbi:unnamed protein product, partial [Nesidiocoris tenuis]
MIVGTAISVDDWVPARPPKKPHLRGAPTVYQQRPPPLRVASPEPPPPSPPAVTEDEILYNADEPLPPPPPEEFLIHRPASLSKHEKARFERAMNASMSLDNLTRSDGKPPPLLLPQSPVHQDTSPGIRPHQDTSASRLDGYYENGSDLKHSHKNGFIEKFNERACRKTRPNANRSDLRPPRKNWSSTAKSPSPFKTAKSHRRAPLRRARPISRGRLATPRTVTIATTGSIGLSRSNRHPPPPPESPKPALPPHCPPTSLQ